MDYTDLYEFNTSTGIIVPNDSAVLLGIQKKFQEIFGTDIDLSAETPVGRLIEAFAVVVKSTLGVTAQVANQFNVNEATGIYLDSIAQIFGMSRIPGTKTKISIKCYFSDTSTGTDTIPAGSLIMCSANGTMFTIDAPITNDGTQIDEATGRRYGLGTASATVTGPILAPIGSVNSIQSSVLGWTGVTNIGPTYIGTDIETDEQFRKRLLLSRPIGTGFNTHLESSLNRLDGVYSSCVLENNTGSPIVTKGIPIPSHSIFVGLDCIKTDELTSRIASAISKAKPIGVGMVNSGVPKGNLIVSNTLSGYDNGSSQYICFYQGVKTPIRISLSYSTGNYVGGDIETDIRESIAEYIGTIGIGERLLGSLISNHLVNKLQIGIGQILIQKEESSIPAGTYVDMMGYESPITTPNLINLQLLS